MQYYVNSNKEHQMNKLTVLVMSLMVCAGAVFGDSGWGLVGSYWDTKDADAGYGLGIKISAEAAPGFMLDFRYTWFDDLGEAAPDIGVTHYTLEVMPIEMGVSILAEPSDRIILFGGGGLGYYKMKGDMRTDDSSGSSISADPDDKIGFYLNGGFEFIVSQTADTIQPARSTIFLEAMYRFVNVTDLAVGDTLALPVDEGNLDGLGVNLGFMVRW
jgi:hypothetical protein